jgi:hypothetical protein
MEKYRLRRIFVFVLRISGGSSFLYRYNYSRLWCVGVQCTPSLTDSLPPPLPTSSGGYLQPYSDHFETSYIGTP